MKNLKNDIWIRGFDSESEFRQYLYGSSGKSYSIEELIYQGKVVDIPDPVLKRVTEKMSIFTSQYRDYNGTHSDYVATPLESIQTATDKEYCIIFIN